MITPETFFGGAIAIESAVDIDLDPLLGRVQRLDVTAAGKSAKLPSALLLELGGPHFLLANCGSNVIALHDKGGNKLLDMASGKAYEVGLAEQEDEDGEWVVQELSILSGCGSGDSRLLYFTGGSSFSYSGDPLTNRTQLFRTKTYAYDPSDNSQTSKTDYPETQSLSEAATTGKSGRFFTHGSREQSGGIAGDHKRYLPLTDAWSQELVQPVNSPPRQEFRAASDGGCTCYHFGGETGGTWVDIYTTWKFDASLNAWDQKTDSAISLKRNVCEFASGEFFCAGWPPSLLYCFGTGHSGQYNQAYNPVTDSWRSAGIHSPVAAGMSEQSSGQGLGNVYAIYGSSCRIFSALAAEDEVHGDGLDGTLRPETSVCPSGDPNCVAKDPRWDKYVPGTDTWSTIQILQFAVPGEPDHFYCQGGVGTASGVGPISGGLDTSYIFQFGGMYFRDQNVPTGGNFMEGLGDIIRYDLVLETEQVTVSLSLPSFHIGATAI